MKRLLLTAALACAVAFASAASPAQAAPPTDAQIDRLMDTMEMRRTLDEMFGQIDAMSESMGMQMLGEDASPQQRESLKRIVSQQQQAMRKAMDWDAMAPIYRRIYARLFTAEEVDAMIAFYGSDTGRGIMRKMPQAMQLSMEEMQPIMMRMMGEMKQSMETEIEHSRKQDGGN